MKFRLTLIGILLGCGLNAPAAESEAEALRAQLQQLRTEFEQTRREQEQRIEALTRKLDALSASAATTAATSAPRTNQATLEKDLAAELAGSAGATAPGSMTAPSGSALPTIGSRSGGSYMNLSFGALTDAGWSSETNPGDQLQLGDHDPAKRGFSLRNAELALDGAVDPYFKGFANIVLKLDHNNETSIELEETFVQSTSLPANLQVKAGQYFAAFGRQNQQHPHTWAFVDQPLILSRAFGPDGLRSIGAQLSWLAPTPFYTEVFLSVLDGQGGTAFSFRNPGEPDETGVERQAGRATITRTLRGAQDLLYVPRVASSFELGSTQTLLVGLSGAFGPNNTGAKKRTAIYGADAYWKWKPANATGGFPFVSWQTEALYRRFQAGADPLAPTPLPEETLRDYGFYSQVVWGFAPRWQTGLRGEYATGNRAEADATDPFRGKRYRVSPQLTFYPSEFSKLRFQYNFDQGDAFGTANSLWLQLEFGLGAHAAHKF